MRSARKAASRRRTKMIQDNSFPCVIGDKFPKYCDRRFPNIEKHKLVPPITSFSASLSNEPLVLSRAAHTCTGPPSEENRKRRGRHYIMSEDQWERFRSWKKPSGRPRSNGDGPRESVSQRSWRQIQKAIFPDNAASRDTSQPEVRGADQDTEDINNFLASMSPRSGHLLPNLVTEFGSPGHLLSSQVVESDQTSASNTTTGTWFSTTCSTVTDPYTHPSTFPDLFGTIMGASGYGDTGSFGIGEAADEVPFGHSGYRFEEFQSQVSVFGAGEWNSNIPMGQMDASTMNAEVDKDAGENADEYVAPEGF
ncbi:hypothetical protein F66182_8269 [Fusarium sp. NRRL 66182]|nr:hypothetical protein F66182_8269 [Fusarium sp. NRRL 66182]